MTVIPTLLRPSTRTGKEPIRITVHWIHVIRRLLNPLQDCTRSDSFLCYKSWWVDMSYFLELNQAENVWVLVNQDAVSKLSPRINLGMNSLCSCTYVSVYIAFFIQGLISVKHHLIGHFMYEDLPVSSLTHHPRRIENQRRYDNFHPDDHDDHAKAGMSHLLLTKTSESNHPYELQTQSCNLHFHLPKQHS